MTVKEIIEILELIKLREIKHNNEINRKCTNPTDSIGAKAIDRAIELLEETKQLKKQERVYVTALKESSPTPCGTCVNRKSCDLPHKTGCVQ
jgi:hypothetical protein